MARKRKPSHKPAAAEVPKGEPAPLVLHTHRTTRRLWGALGVVVALAAAAVLTVARRSGGPFADRPLLPFPPQAGDGGEVVPVGTADFVGSEACASCHQSQFRRWSASTHAAAGGPPSAARVIARFSGTPIRFRDAVVIPERQSGSWRFVVRQGNKPERVYRVDGVVGGGHMQGGGTQGFVSRLADGTLRFLPFDFIRREDRWFCNTNSRANRGWVPITPELPLAACGDWPPNRVLGDEVRFANCQSCHGSQIEVTVDTAAHRYLTSYTSLGINCESCHGPGRRHIDLVRDSAAVATGEIGMVPLATLGKDASLGVCWQCHALKDQLRPGYRSGQRLDAYYSIHFPQLGDAAHLPDGRVRTFAYQQGHLYSDCYVSGGMTCTSCHDPHTQRYRDVAGRPLAGRDDDRQCTSCHASKAAEPEQHTKHPPGSAGSRCVACHMPYLQEPEIGTALRYARSDHAIPVPRPAADSALGVRSACQTCHQDRSEATLDAQVRAWYSELKPVAPTIAAVLAGREESDPARAATWLLLPDAPHTAALFAGLAAYVDRHLAPSVAPPAEATGRLQRLAVHRDLDVRGLALAALHLTSGDEAEVRAFLVTQLQRQGADERLVRRRWFTALGYFGDKRRAAGDALGAITAYDKALAIEPAHARLHLNRGLALAGAGRLLDAAAAYRASLAIDRLQPLAQVNLGIALAASGDRLGAISAYTAALSINAREPLAHFNVGNLQLESGQLDEAAGSYRQAIAADPSLSLAHFYLARILAQRGDLRGAVTAIDAGLEFDANNPEALGARAQLTRLLSSAR